MDRLSDERAGDRPRPVCTSYAFPECKLILVFMKQSALRERIYKCDANGTREAEMKRVINRTVAMVVAMRDVVAAWLWM